MARRPRSDPGAGGFPEHGEELPTEDPPIGGGDPGDEDDNPPELEPKPDPVAELRAEMTRMQLTHAEEMATLRRTIPPIEPKPAPVPEQGPDYKNLLFTDPAEAVRLIKAEAVKEARDAMTAAYMKDQGTRKFWDGFYDKHKDLKDDHDLVELVLNSSLSSLANIPVAQAMEKLADLTRDRILRYSGGVKQKGKKTFSEGNSPPRARGEPSAEAEVTSLGDIIKARRQRRSKATAA